MAAGRSASAPAPERAVTTALDAPKFAGEELGLTQLEIIINHLDERRRLRTALGGHGRLLQAARRIRQHHRRRTRTSYGCPRGRGRIGLGPAVARHARGRNPRRDIKVWQPGFAVSPH